MTASTLSASLSLLVAQVTIWLTPSIGADCRRQDAAKLRIFLANLTEARDQARAQEEGLIDPEQSLSATMEGLAESFAKWPDGVMLERRAIQRFVAVFNEAAAHAWALEMAMRLHAGIIADTDIDTLTLARKLRRGGVARASRLGPDQSGGGDAA